MSNPEDQQLRIADAIRLTTERSLKSALQLTDNRASELRQRLVIAVEAICQEYEAEGVLPIVEVTTNPEVVYGGYARRVRANAKVRFSRALEGKPFDGASRIREAMNAMMEEAAGQRAEIK